MSEPEFISKYVPKAPRMTSFIPGVFADVLAKKALLLLAEAKGYSPADIELLRAKLFEMREPVLVRIDDEEDEEAE